MSITLYVVQYCYFAVGRVVVAYKTLYQASGINASKLATAQKMWNQVESLTEDCSKAILELKAKPAKNEERAF